MLQTYHIGEGDEILWQTHAIMHHTTCLKREELMEAAIDKNKYLSRFEVNFKYKPFKGNRVGNFEPVSTELNDCPFFEENGMTYDEYIKKYRELA